MKNNVVKKHNSNGVLAFDLELDTEEKPPYILIIKDINDVKLSKIKSITKTHSDSQRDKAFIKNITI